MATIKKKRKPGGGAKPLSKDSPTVKRSFRLPENLDNFIKRRAEMRKEDPSAFIRSMLLREMKRMLKREESKSA